MLHMQHEFVRVLSEVHGIGWQIYRHSIEMNSDLYPRLLGAAWWSLAESVRQAHAVGKDRRGCFRVAHGTSWLARRLAGWSGLPRGAGAAQVRLRITAEGSRQRWERHFDDETFTTSQWADGGGLVERFGAWELCFELRVENATLRYVQRGARLCLGAFRLRVPLAWAPLVSAQETGDGPERVLVTVAVTLPVVGSLIAYDGHLDVGGLAG